MGSLIVVLTAFAVYCSEVYCDTLPTKVAKLEDIVLPERSNNSHAIEKGTFWKNLSLSKRKPTKVEESRNLDGINSEPGRRKARFLSSLAFLTGLSFGGLATAASSSMKSIAKMPQMFSINLGSSKASPYFAAYYSQYPYSPLFPYPFFYPGPFGLSPMINAAKPQTSHHDLTPQLINLFDNRPIDLAENNEDYTDGEKSSASNGADDRIRLRAEADRNAEEKGMIRGCKDGQRKRGNVSKGTAREREYIQMNANDDLRAILNFQVANQTSMDNATMTTSSRPEANTTQHHHHHHHHHHGGHKEYPHFPGYYGGYPQNIHHVELTTQPYSQIYNVPYEQPANFYDDDKYNVYPHLNPPFTAPYPSDHTSEYAGTDFNRLYPSYHLPNISDGFKPVK